MIGQKSWRENVICDMHCKELTKSEISRLADLKKEAYKFTKQLF